jgi:hypothetical protein
MYGLVQSINYFLQIDENIIYHENENEFDINKSEVSIYNNKQIINEEEEEFIDILSINGNEEDIVWVSIDPLSDEDINR